MSLCANEGVLIALLRKMKSNILNQSRLTIISNYGSKRVRSGDLLHGAVHAKVAPSYVEEQQNSGTKRYFAEAVWNRHETDGADLTISTPIWEQHAFAQDVASRGFEDDVETPDAKNDWDLEGVVFADELAASGVREKLSEIQHVCKDGSKAIPTSVLELFNRSREVVETKQDNAKLPDCTDDLIIELYKSRASEHLARDRIQKAEGLVKTLEQHVKESYPKYLANVAEVAQFE